jgi:hypothetical protein
MYLCERGQGGQDSSYLHIIETNPSSFNQKQMPSIPISIMVSLRTIPRDMTKYRSYRRFTVSTSRPSGIAQMKGGARRLWEYMRMAFGHARESSVRERERGWRLIVWEAIR